MGRVRLFRGLPLISLFVISKHNMSTAQNVQCWYSSPVSTLGHRLLSENKKPLPSSTYNLLWITIAQRWCGRRWGETCAGVVDTEVNRKQGWGEKTLVVECACLLSLHANFLGRLLNRILICSVFMIQKKCCHLRGQYNLIINTNAWTYMHWWAHTCTKKCILYV